MIWAGWVVPAWHRLGMVEFETWGLSAVSSSWSRILVRAPRWQRVYIYIHVRIDMYIYKYTYTDIYTYIHTHIYIHIYVYVQIHTNIHVYLLEEDTDSGV